MLKEEKNNKMAENIAKNPPKGNVKFSVTLSDE